MHEFKLILVSKKIPCAWQKINSDNMGKDNKFIPKNCYQKMNNRVQLNLEHILRDIL